MDDGLQTSKSLIKISNSPYTEKNYLIAATQALKFEIIAYLQRISLWSINAFCRTIIKFLESRIPTKQLQENPALHQKYYLKLPNIIEL